MEDLKVKANNYAEENVINVLKEAFAKVYADGYRDGYKDCKEENLVDLRNNQTEFVDLGLPSGTLWANDYEKIDNDIIYLPHNKANTLNIPSVEQWKELATTCKWESFGKNGYLDKAVCVGPNGETLTFAVTGMDKCEQSRTLFFHAMFWLKDNQKEFDKLCVEMAGIRNNFSLIKSKQFSGYKLPIRFVKSK